MARMVCPGARFLLILRNLWLALAAAGWMAAQDPPGPADDAPESVLFQPLPAVEAATLHTQTLDEAPASVTVISAQEIRTYGWRTLGEALAAVRDFYITSDRTFQYAGIRGFSLPGDYTTRLLMMVNGHYLTDNVYSSDGLFGQNFPLDMDLVERIEIVRGPSSALYGSNGVFATINIVTKSPVEARMLRASTETGSFGEKKLELSSGMNLGGGANLLISASAFNDSGQSLYFPGLGWAENADGERGYHAFATLVWRNWTFTGLLGSREQQVPTGQFGSVLGDPGNHVATAGGFFEAAYTRDLSASRKMRWRMYYDQMRYGDRYDAALPDGGLEDSRDRSRGDWVGSQLAYDFAIPRVGVLTVGGEVNADIRAQLEFYEQAPERVAILNVDHPDVSYGTFAQQQWQISSDWAAYFGVRFDDSRLHSHFVSPRGALIYRPTGQTSYKLLYGRAFRNPNAFESYYADGVTQISNPSLSPERTQTFEAVVERKLGQHWRGTVDAYHYQLQDLIEAVPVAGGLMQYQNSGDGRAEGVGAELSGKPARWIETTGSLAWMQPKMENQAWLVNSPSYIAKWRAAGPVFRDKVWAAAAMQYLSTRRTVGGDIVPSVWLTDLTLTTRKLHPDFDMQFGVRNLFNRVYYDPAGVDLPEQMIPQNGRSIFLKLIARTRE
jgi:outer membrane receptor for ferrienterochelin and colicins